MWSFFKLTLFALLEILLFHKPIKVCFDPWDSKSPFEPVAIYFTNEYHEALKALDFVSSKNIHYGKGLGIFMKCLLKNNASLFAIVF